MLPNCVDNMGGSTQEILKSDKLELLEDKKFAELKTLYEKLCELEEIDEAETTAE